MRTFLFFSLIFFCSILLLKASDQVSIQQLGVKPENSPHENKVNLQKAIDWASEKGVALFVEPSDEPYPVEGGIILKKNVSLIGVHGPTPRGTVHPSKKKQPVGSVFKITDRDNVFITVETGTQIKGIQFWYAQQTINNPSEIIAYPATIQVSKTSMTQGVYLSCLTFYGEYLAMDFNAGPKLPCELMIFEHCYGYPLHSFVEMTQQMERPWWPTFPDVTGDGRKMNSNHGVASVIDAYRKGLRGFDLEKAYVACKGAITEKTLMPWSGKPAGKLDQFYKDRGYIPALKEGEKETNPEVHSFEKRQPVAVTLGTAYDEWCLSQIAKELGKTDDYKHFLKQSYNYRNLMHPETGFFHPKDSDGKFIEPFDYIFSGGIGARDYYDENNAWTYRWDVQHNVADLISLMGGHEKFVSGLDAMFATPLGKNKYGFYSQLPDQTGNVGQFTMANEPSLHIPYLYNYAGQPWKTQKRIRALLAQWFRNDLMGIPGDEDGGGMTSFVVFSQMGFYPVTPGMPVYNIGSPAFDRVKMDLGNGKFFEIEAVNNSAENKYIQSATLNGKPWNKPWFSHSDLISGGKLVLNMGPKANRNWGIAENDAPPSAEKLN